MAKVKVIFGKLHGKIGGTVFRGGEDGMTIASEYNGKPANPRTMLQTSQRNKMNLAGQFSKLTPYDAIVGLDASRRKARSMFVSNLLKNTEQASSTTPGGVSSRIQMGAIVFSKGVLVSTTIAKTFDADTTKATITITNNEQDVDVMGYRVILVAGVSEKVVGVSVRDVTLTSGQSSVALEVTVPDNILGGRYDIYVVPMVETNANARAVFMQGLAQNGAYMSAEAVRTLNTLNALASSIYGGTLTLDE